MGPTGRRAVITPGLVVPSRCHATIAYVRRESHVTGWNFCTIEASRPYFPAACDSLVYGNRLVARCSTLSFFPSWHVCLLFSQLESKCCEETVPGRCLALGRWRHKVVFA